MDLGKAAMVASNRSVNFVTRLTTKRVLSSTGAPPGRVRDAPGKVPAGAELSAFWPSGTGAAWAIGASRTSFLFRLGAETFAGGVAIAEALLRLAALLEGVRARAVVLPAAGRGVAACEAASFAERGGIATVALLVSCVPGSTVATAVVHNKVECGLSSGVTDLADPGHKRSCVRGC